MHGPRVTWAGVGGRSIIGVFISLLGGRGGGLGLEVGGWRRALRRCGIAAMFGRLGLFAYSKGVFHTNK